MTGALFCLLSKAYELAHLDKKMGGASPLNKLIGKLTLLLSKHIY